MARSIDGRGTTRYVQRQAFPVCIKNNLREYEGRTVFLLEMLANADDAGAENFTVCLDYASHPKEDLLPGSMLALQGAAMIVSNDVAFSQADFRNYTQNVGNSSKTNDPGTIGRFGKGALTVYALTDAVQLVSGCHLLVLDPQGTHLASHLTSWSCNFVDPTAEDYVPVSNIAPGHLGPFIDYSEACDSVTTLEPRTQYTGSIFRLALRGAEAAAQSQISNQSVTPEQLLPVLNSFCEMAPELLLFTRHIRNIYVYTRKSAGTKATLYHHSSAHSGPPTLLPAQLQKQMLTVNVKNAGRGNSQHVWLKVINLAANGGGIAIPLNEPETGQTPSAFSGKLFCTLPLALEVTALPVHVNGSFLVSSNRKSLWEGEGDGGKVGSAMLTSGILPI